MLDMPAKIVQCMLLYCNVADLLPDDDSDVEEIQHKTGDYLSKSASLPKGVLQIKQCTDLNKDSPLKVRSLYKCMCI